MIEIPDITNSEICHIIDEHIRHERDRKILKRKIVDGITYDKLAEEFDLSRMQAIRIVQKREAQIAKYLK